MIMVSLSTNHGKTAQCILCRGKRCFIEQTHSTHDDDDDDDDDDYDDGDNDGYDDDEFEHNSWENGTLCGALNGIMIIMRINSDFEQCDNFFVLVLTFLLKKLR